VVEPQNPVQLADAIIDVLEGDKRRTMGENAVRVVRERYSQEYVVAAYTGIFLGLLESDQRLR
jgi:glycosyltransferase involved in cell wall biosynthesis